MEIIKTNYQRKVRKIHDLEEVKVSVRIGAIEF